MSLKTFGSPIDAPSTDAEDTTARSGFSLLKGIKNYLRTLASAVSGTAVVVADGGGSLTVDGTVTANLGTIGAAATEATAATLATEATAATLATEATAATLATEATAATLATEATLSTLSGNVTKCNTDDVTVGDVAIPAVIVHGQKTVASAGTEEALGASTELTSGVRVKALAGNTNNVYVGANPVTSGTGFVLDAGEEVFIEVANLATVYIDVDTNGEGVSYIGG